MQSLLQEPCMPGLINESKNMLNGKKTGVILGTQHSWVEQQCHNNNSNVQVSDPCTLRSAEVQARYLCGGADGSAGCGQHFPPCRSISLTDGPRILDQANLQHSST